jgi:hypothetical protein
MLSSDLASDLFCTSSEWSIVTSQCAGIGGLTAGAILNTLYGKKVGIFESHYLPGGCAHAFERKASSSDVVKGGRIGSNNNNNNSSSSTNRTKIVVYPPLAQIDNVITAATTRRYIACLLDETTTTYETKTEEWQFTINRFIVLVW